MNSALHRCERCLCVLDVGMKQSSQFPIESCTLRWIRNDLTVCVRERRSFSFLVRIWCENNNCLCSVLLSISLSFSIFNSEKRALIIQQTGIKLAFNSPTSRRRRKKKSVFSIIIIIWLCFHIAYLSLSSFFCLITSNPRRLPCIV